MGSYLCMLILGCLSENLFPLPSVSGISYACPFTAPRLTFIIKLERGFVPEARCTSILVIANCKITSRFEVFPRSTCFIFPSPSFHHKNSLISYHADCQTRNRQHLTDVLLKFWSFSAFRFPTILLVNFFRNVVS